MDDTTKRKLLEEELRRKNDEVEHLIYAVTHDLRSPLLTILSFLGYLEQDLTSSDAERIAKDIGYIQGAAKRMDALLKELLEMARIGKAVTPSVTTTLREIVNAALDALAGKIKENNIDIRIINTNLTLYGDTQKLTRIWQNLIENAVKYMGENTPSCIEIGFDYQSTDTVFFVRDTGIGIAPEFNERIFGVFEQLDKQREGVGMGLALVKRIIEIYGGRIWVESAGKDMGSCFKFTLPGALSTKDGKEFFWVPETIEKIAEKTSRSSDYTHRSCITGT